MEIRYDKKTKRLLYFKTLSSHNWDRQWNTFDIKHTSENLSKYNLIRRITQKYLDTHDGPIIEGGCGLGQFVYSLTEAGYNCIGIDTAEGTIAKIKQIFPHLDVKHMDVNRLDFPDNYFVGYWSLGVIEHFRNGYDEIIDEMFRVIKPGGYIFLTVPAMSLLRRYKALSGQYPILSKDSGSNENKNFYQFVLCPDRVIKDFCERRFIFLKSGFMYGIKGLKDEISVLRKPIEFLDKVRHKNIITKLLVLVLDCILAPIAGHTCIFIFQKPLH